MNGLMSVQDKLDKIIKLLSKEESNPTRKEG